MAKLNCPQDRYVRQDVEQRGVTDLEGGLAQLGEHLLCKQGVVGSIPSSSTIIR